ncbi:MAG: HAMP domain-containing sensor histidine kinase [Anaerococcus sp.]|nr:HAMP domain-containing sensor histidine kinase [Peptoniphilaceae bacterium]MDY3054927.1 HAMP domain-containing sensor histidine kinase [Anaerococcus sp.]
MEGKLKQRIFSYFFEMVAKFSLAFFISRLILKLSVDFEKSRIFLEENLKSQTEIMVGLSIIFLTYFIYDFYWKIDKLIFLDLKEILKSIRENSYDSTYESHEFQEISNALEEKSKEILEKDKDLIRGISYISHDMKTPVTVIKTNISLIRNSKDTLSNENTIRMERIFDESEKISQYINTLMKVSKSQLAENKAEKIYLKDLLESMMTNVSLYRDMLEENIGIDLKVENLNKFLYANKSSINECLVQLLNNAYEHRKKEINVSIKANENLEIYVMDDGDGFNCENLEDNKKLFITSNKGRTQGKGYGIGLFYVNSYMEKIQGRLDLYNDKNGAVARLVLPMEEDNE